MPIAPEALQFQTADGVRLHCLYWKSRRAQDADAKHGKIGDVSPEAKTPIVLLHGGGANAHWWDRIANPLSSNRDVYALNFRGHGDSEHPDERFVGAFNTDLEALLARLGRDDVILIGHSMGAAVALDHASRFPATCGIVLVDLARGGPPGGGRRARLALALRRTYRSREEAIERFQFLPESSVPDEEIRLYIAERSIQDEPDGRFGYKFDPRWFALPPRPRPNLDEVLCPCLLVRGGESTLLSTESATKFVSQLTRASLREIPGAGHHVLIDQPDLLLEAIQDFLARFQSSTFGTD